LILKTGNWSVFSLIVLMLAISCKGKLEKTDADLFANIQFSLDTVSIDPGDEILFLKHQLLNGDMGKEGKHFFNFNGDDHTLEIIEFG